MTTEQVIWVMDTDCCDVCDALLDYFGQCPNGCELLEFEEDDFYEDDIYDLDFNENGKYIGG